MKTFWLFCAVNEGGEIVIYDLLGIGKGGARTAAELGEFIGMQPREVTRMIERERQGGKIICADNDGYYKPASPDEAALYLYRRGLRTRTIARGTEAMQGALDEWIGQETLDFEVL